MTGGAGFPGLETLKLSSLHWVRALTSWVPDSDWIPFNSLAENEFVTQKKEELWEAFVNYQLLPCQ